VQFFFPVPTSFSIKRMKKKGTRQYMNTALWNIGFSKESLNHVTLWNIGFYRNHIVILYESVLIARKTQESRKLSSIHAIILGLF
jgi:hypothetical protein